ncbi:toll/interleukin-1 receptor domain-containing protein [Parasphingopyxis algicola]|uniref:toll/interleukin-1 receptor domain-containing protein n=1 Tax=Parasphingopyxis algicola TaxID=2026624 RepID=UPI00159F8A64|nr:toll/interleukin-1 receptor domain-containing protein [Parasphingopyxis algicola]QLC25835.1 toll/interleukin-1 receptor domain-containing protein [Parasphingopyxis algicola]
MNDAADPGSDEDEPRPVAFISHHSSQEQTARHLKTILERNGVEGWMAPDDIEPGVVFDKAIVDQVRRSDMVVLLFCAKSDQSDHVRRELTLAVDNKKLIYPVRLEDIDAEGLAYWLSGYQWIDWIDRRDATIQRLIDTIKLQAGDDGASGAQATTPSRARGRSGRNRIAWLGGGAAIAVAGIAAAWFLIGGEADAELKVLPGSWVREMTVHTPVAAGDGREAAEALFDRLDLQSSAGCIGAIESTNPGISFFDPDGRHNCSMDGLSEGVDAKLLAEFTCRPAALDGGTATFALDVTPERNTKILADGNLTIRDGAGGQSLYEVEFHYFYAGKNC